MNQREYNPIPTISGSDIYSSSHYLHNLESLLIFGSCEFLAPRRSSYDCPYTTMLHNVLSKYIAFAMKQQFFSDMLLKPNKRTRPPKNFDFQLIPLFFPRSIVTWASKFSDRNNFSCKTPLQSRRTGRESENSWLDGSARRVQIM